HTHPHPHAHTTSHAPQLALAFSLSISISDSLSFSNDEVQQLWLQRLNQYSYSSSIHHLNLINQTTRPSAQQQREHNSTAALHLSLPLSLPLNLSLPPSLHLSPPLPLPHLGLGTVLF